MGRAGNGGHADLAIDSLPDVGLWWLRAGISIARMFKPRRRYPADLDITLIAPSEELGDVNDAVFWKRENIERWVALGQRDAAAALRRMSGRELPASHTIEPSPQGY